MRILIPSIQVPFIQGGSVLMTEGLKNALVKHGHEVEIVTMPFKFSPVSYIQDLISFWKKQDFNNFNGYEVDIVIVLQFPAYYVKHKNKVLWLMHQHRSSYDLYNEKYVKQEDVSLKREITLNDTKELGAIKKRFSMCENITHRLQNYNVVDSIPLYHPPENEKEFYCDQSLGYVFYPSRLEELKRQDLLIRAMEYTKSDAVLIIAGTGGQYDVYSQLVKSLKISDKVKLVGYITEKEKYVYYARSLCVAFTPLDEDYGYITLEAMLSSKPVITCKDSGGPLEFVEDNKTGFIVDPVPKEIAKKIDWLYNNQDKSQVLGRNGRTQYMSKEISWDNVVETLLGR